MREANQTEITAIFCSAICTGKLSPLLAEFIDDDSTWIVASGAPKNPGLDNSQRCFHGIGGLQKVIYFCHNDLRIASGVMTGCVIREDSLFGFGKIRLDREGLPETYYVVKLVWSRLQIRCAELRIMWPFPPKAAG